MNFLKKAALTATVLIVMLSSALVFAKITHTLLVIDTVNEIDLPDKFRMTSDVLPANLRAETEGLNRVHAAGSAQFSSDGLGAALKKIPSRSVVVVDLRRESHGQLNDEAVSWYGPQNAANEKKSTDQIRESETRLLSKLKKARFRWVYQIVEKTDDDFIEKTHRDFVRVQSVKTEQQVAQDHHVGYKRFYVEDFHAPENADVTRFVNFARQLPENTWLYFHCRAGRGRTTTFMSMYDMMKNAKHVSFDDIIQRQFALGGSDLRELPDKNHFKYRYAAHRLSFIKNFYEYARENNDNFSTTWDQWRRKHPVKSS